MEPGDEPIEESKESLPPLGMRLLGAFLWISVSAVSGLLLNAYKSRDGDFWGMIVAVLGVSIAAVVLSNRVWIGILLCVLSIPVIVIVMLLKAINGIRG